MANAITSFGPKLGLLNNAAIDKAYYDQFRPFLRGMDALVQCNVLNITSTPPPTPSNGDAYIVNPAGTGAWLGQDNKVAVWTTQATLPGSDTLASQWDFYAPQTGWTVYCVATSQFYYFNASGVWVKQLATVSAAGTVIPDGTTITVSGAGVITAAAAVPVPTATVLVKGIVQPDGSTITVSAGVISVPTAIVGHLGLVKPDGSTVTVSAGVISVPTATGSTLGLVKPDGATITIAGGALSATATPTATASTLGVVKPDNTTITVTGGVITATGTTSPVATASTLGIVQPDNTSITISSGVISATPTPTATGFSLGVVKPDGTTTTISGGILSAVLPSNATVSTFGLVKPDNSTITISSGVISAAPPTVATATASTLGVVKPDNSTILISSGVISAPNPLATAATLGVVRPDNSTITVASGVLSATVPTPATATASTLGIVKPDNSTITISGGVLSAGTSSTPQATATTYGIVKPDNTTITISSGVISAHTATASILGVIKPDNSTITISSGVISAAAAVTATSSTLGVVKPDNTTLTISSGVLSVAGFNNPGWGSPPSVGSAGSYFVQAYGAIYLPSFTTGTVSTPTHVTAGNTLVLLVYGSSGTSAPAFTSSLGNTYTNVWGPSGYGQTYIYVATSVLGGAVETITFSANASAAMILEYTGLHAGSASSITLAAVTNVSDGALGPVTLSHQAVVVQFQCDVATTHPNYATVTPSLTQRYLNGSYSFYVGDVLSASGSYVGSMPVPSGGGTYAGLIALSTP